MKDQKTYMTTDQKVAGSTPAGRILCCKGANGDLWRPGNIAHPIGGLIVDMILRKR